MKAFRNQKVKIERISVNFTLIWNVHEIDVAFKDFFFSAWKKTKFIGVRRRTHNHKPTSWEELKTRWQIAELIRLSCIIGFLFFFFVFRVSSLSCKVYVCIWHSVHKVLRLFAGKWETNRYFTHTLGWIDTADGGWRTDVSDNFLKWLFWWFVFQLSSASLHASRLRQFIIWRQDSCRRTSERKSLFSMCLKLIW